MLGLWRKNCSVKEIIDSIRPSLERKALIKGITLDCEIESVLPQVYCDEEKVVRVLINLTINAIKFSPPSGKVRVWATESVNSSDVLIGVTDNGPGMSQEILSKIFARFQQFELNRQPDTKGFGLGLSIAKELVELNFGEMRVESVPGKGSTFSFTLPPADPVEVLNRYLTRLHRSRHHGSSDLSLLEASIDPATDVAVADDVEAYLTGLLKRHDLLFRLGRGRWLLALATSDLELDKFQTRAMSALNELNRNRLRGPLPAVEFDAKGSWHTYDQREDLFAAVHELLDSKEALYA
jgi:hypothetical protein